MSIAHLFNPDNDMALACDAQSYTPPRGAMALCRAGRLLPAWLAAPGDAILIDGSVDSVASAVLGATSTCAATPELLSGVSGARPWGWSRAAVARLAAAGVPRGVMPGEEALAGMRRLSGRPTAVRLLEMIGIEHSFVAATRDEVEEALDCFEGKVFVKSPWSCSGRGVVNVSAMSRRSGVEIAMGMVSRQGCVVIERALDRRLDFAALFDARADGMVSFAGWSVFETAPSGSYMGNLVAPQEVIAARLSRYDRDDCLARTVGRLEKALGAVLDGRYTGPLGVDMMFHGDDMRLHPCVEINLRLTMGWVAMALARYFDSTRHLVYDRDCRLDGLTVSGCDGYGRFLLSRR